MIFSISKAVCVTPRRIVQLVLLCFSLLQQFSLARWHLFIQLTVVTSSSKKTSCESISFCLVMVRIKHMWHVYSLFEC